ncbi:MAG TPA: hypothetical protein VGL92_12265, partial [Acidimicrobiia bacterium]
MQNVWKGLVVGGLTGVAAGVLLDILEGAFERAGTAREHLRERTPELKDRARHAAEVASERLREADLPEKARQAAERAAERVKDADLAEKARLAAERAAEMVKEADLPEKARHAAEMAREKAR